MQIISIVPQLRPAIDGLGDYALNLAHQLRQDFNIQTNFIVGNPKWHGASEIDGFAISQVSDRTADNLLSVLLSHQPCPLLLHYVGYGYAQRGCPVWLVKGLQRWKTLFPQQPLITMFHEVFASGLPWNSAFWLSPLQKSLAASLTQLSDRCFTSKQLYAQRLTNLSHGKHEQIPVLPVFSTIGEPNQILPLSQRQQRLVVFGGVANRTRVYQQSQSVLSYVCQRLNIQEIWDIGTPTGLGLSSINQVPIREMGEQSAIQVSQILANSVAGFLDYNPDFLAKSSIFSAYCAHGLLPINLKASTSEIDGIIPGKHYWVPKNSQNQQLVDDCDFPAIANDAYLWYQTHKLSVQSSIFAGNLFSDSANLNVSC